MSLRLKPMAIGSLPHDNTQQAIDYVFSLYKEIPFFPQLANVNRLEDMVFQCIQGVPSVKYDEDNIKYIFDMSSEKAFEELEQFYLDYETIINENDHTNLQNYAITEPYSSTIKPFFKKIAQLKPKYAKGQVIGPFTWGTILCDDVGRCAFFDETNRDIVVKSVALKALWQIETIKKASPDTTPIIFLDEPAICQYGTSAFVTVKKQEILDALKEVSDIIKQTGALSAIHCCGKADWEMIVDIGVDIVNLDAYLYAQNLCLFPKKIEKFLKSNGYVAWGVVPTLDKNALSELDLPKAIEIFETAISYLTKKGIDKELIINHSILTPSCGAGSLDLNLAEKAMELNIELSNALRQKYGEDI